MNNIDKAAELIKSSKRIIVFTGAGISTSCGIPDFRGKNGLYGIIGKKFNLPYPEAVFDISYFKSNPDPFFELSKDFFSQNIKPSISHDFIAWLDKNNKISLVVTQNIDMLHEKSGCKNVVACHGSYEKAHCIKCNKSYQLSDIEIYLKNGKVPYCHCKGIIKPDIVFFGEQLPENFYEVYNNTPAADLLLVMGTSLAVQPAANFAIKLTQKIKSIIINIDETNYDNLFSYSIHDDLDRTSKYLWDKINK